MKISKEKYHKALAIVKEYERYEILAKERELLAYRAKQLNCVNHDFQWDEISPPWEKVCRCKNCRMYEPTNY